MKCAPYHHRVSFQVKPTLGDRVARGAWIVAAILAFAAAALWLLGWKP